MSRILRWTALILIADRTQLTALRRVRDMDVGFGRISFFVALFLT